MKKTLFWLLSFLVTASFAVFQRLTGPTYPVKGGPSAAGSEAVASYRFPRSCTVGEGDCEIKIRADSPLDGRVAWRRYKTGDAYADIPLIAYREGWRIGRLPDQPPAGKLEYRVFIRTGAGDAQLGGPVVARFKGPVPAWVLIPHIALMFLFMLFSVRIFLSAAFNLEPVRHSVPATVAFLLLGGFVFGPLTQYYAFGQAWTGFPFGYDLTDNKTLLMLLAWLPALRAVLKEKPARLWLNLAFAVTAAVYLVPHSLFGSELDYAKGQVVTGK